MKIKDLERFIMFQEQALLEDDPKSTCAAFHRGAIAAYNRIIAELKIEEEIAKRKQKKNAYQKTS